MKPIQVLIIGAAVVGLVWWYTRSVPAGAPSTNTEPEFGSNFGDFFATPVARTRPPDAPILGTAVPRTTTIGTGGTRGAQTTAPTAPTSIAVNYGAWGSMDEETIEDLPTFQEAL